MEEIPYAEEVKELHTQFLAAKKVVKKCNKLSLNCIMCIHCNDIIISEDGDVLRRCKCGKVAIHGGFDYLMRSGVVNEDYEELSIWKP